MEWTAVTSLTTAIVQRDTKKNYVPFHIWQNFCTPVECGSLYYSLLQLIKVLYLYGL
jgi:hypothetical protein